MLDTSIFNEIQKTDTLEGFPKFLQEWDEEFINRTKKIALFDKSITSKWTKYQKELFVKLLYHQRSHFDDVLWYMGNFAPDSATKEMILDNIRDEFGKGGRSHEKLYLDFANCMGIDLTYELIEEKFYLPFLREYNRGHLQWLRDHDWTHRLSAFAALERLDNVDYLNLKNVVESFNLEKVDVLFFKVHIYVKHFEGAQGCQLDQIWNEQPNIIHKVFNFIGDYQIEIWKKISDTILNHNLPD